MSSFLCIQGTAPHLMSQPRRHAFSCKGKRTEGFSHISDHIGLPFQMGSLNPPPLPHTGSHLFTLQTVLQRTTVLKAYGKPSQFSLKIINSRLVPQASDEREPQLRSALLRRSEVKKGKPECCFPSLTSGNCSCGDFAHSFIACKNCKEAEESQ